MYAQEGYTAEVLRTLGLALIIVLLLLLTGYLFGPRCYSSYPSGGQDGSGTTYACRDGIGREFTMTW